MIKFAETFNAYICDGDAITWRHGQWLAAAKVLRDAGSGPPDQEDEGFWPSLDPSDPGYIGPKSKSTLRRRMAAWQRDEWWWCGVEVTLYRLNPGVDPAGRWDEEDLSEVDQGSLWCIGCNYPTFRKRDRPNAYLDTVADDLLREVLHNNLPGLVFDVMEARSK